MRAFPGNPNVMPGELLSKLEANIQREQDYPPLIVRTHPTEPGAVELLDGEQRFTVLCRSGFETVRCYMWECDDATAMLLHTTLNGLHGNDEPWRRAELLRQLAELIPVDELAELVPESAADLQQTLGALDANVDELLKQFEADADAAIAKGPCLYSFAVAPEDAPVIDQALELGVAEVIGPNRRAQVFVAMARAYVDRLGGADE